MNKLRINIHIARSDFKIEVNETLPAQGVSAIFGHSGSGKTTLLRCIAGLEKQCHGELSFRDSVWQNNNLKLAAHKRPIGYVFQEASLFAHLNAENNLRFATKRAWPGKLIDLADAIDMLGIGALLKRYPAQLSGGERQRVAIARALLINPQLLLMDEPLSSLDPSRKQEVMPYLERLRNELNIPIIYVSHAPDEIARLADHLLVLENGKVLASGELKTALSKLDFPIPLGEDTGSILEGKIKSRDAQWQLASIKIDDEEFWFRDKNYNIGEHVRLRILARDVSLSLQKVEDTSILNCLRCKVVEIENESQNNLVSVKLQVGNQYLISRISRRSAHQLDIQPGNAIWALIKSVAII